MKKILSLLMVLTLIITTLGGLTAFADTDFGVPTLTAVYDSYDAAKGYHYVIVRLDGFQNFEEAWEDDDFEMNVKGISAYEFSVTTDNADAAVVNAAKTSDAILGFTRNGAKNGGGYLYSSLEDYCTVTSGNIAKIYVRAAEDAKFTLSFGFCSISVNDVVAGKATQIDFTTSNSKLKTVPLTVGATDEPEEEEFGIASTGSTLAGTDKMKDENGEDVDAAGDKVVAIFSKNISDEELAAGSYGIIFGGVRYAGQAKVPAKTAWAIKLVGSAEQLPAGSYSYGVYAGDAVVNADSAWVIE